MENSFLVFDETFKHICTVEGYSCYSPEEMRLERYKGLWKESTVDLWNEPLFKRGIYRPQR